MTLILDFLLILWMLTGLMLTLTPRIPGTIVILAGVYLYGYLTEFVSLKEGTSLTLFLLAVVAELGGRLLRNRLTRPFPFSPSYSSNVTVGNVGGIIASDVLLGIIGLFMWQFAVGKNTLPRLDTIGRLLLRSSVVAFIRFACGFTMVVITIIFVIF